MLHLFVHLFFALQGGLAQAFEDEGVDVVIVLMLSLCRKHGFLGCHVCRGGGYHGYQREKDEAVANGLFRFHCAMDIIFQSAKLHSFIGMEGRLLEK